MLFRSPSVPLLSPSMPLLSPSAPPSVIISLSASNDPLEVVDIRTLTQCHYFIETLAIHKATSLSLPHSISLNLSPSFSLPPSLYLTLSPSLSLSLPLSLSQYHFPQVHVYQCSYIDCVPKESLPTSAPNVNLYQ